VRVCAPDLATRKAGHERRVEEGVRIGPEHKPGTVAFGGVPERVCSLCVLDEGVFAFENTRRGMWSRGKGGLLSQILAMHVGTPDLTKLGTSG